MLDVAELATAAKEIGAPLELVRSVADAGRLPVVMFCAGGIATPADASLVMQLGAEGVFVGSGIFKSDDPAARAAAIVKATTHYADPASVAEASEGLGRGDGEHRVAQAARSSCSPVAAGSSWSGSARDPGRLRGARRDPAGDRGRRPRGPHGRRPRGLDAS